MATSVIGKVERDFRECGWVFDNPFRFMPLYNGENERVRIFPRYVESDQPRAIIINLWPQTGILEMYIPTGSM